MTRVRAGIVTRKRHKKILKTTKGYKGTLKASFKKAKQAWIKAGQHAYKHRREKKRDMRGLWITRINASLRALGYKYSEFIGSLKKNNIMLDRKVLSKIAADHPKVFESLVKKVK